MTGPLSTTRPTAVLLHFLGGSARTWGLVSADLADRFRCMAVDLPGFGDTAGVPGYTVSEMADAVAKVIRAEAPQRWILVGHSMGAKVAAVLARRAEDGEAGLDGLSHLVLLAGSPPGLEPMADARRATMKGWFDGDDASNQANAQTFIDDSTGTALPPVLYERTVAEVLRADRRAWLAWLDGGSREDWASRIGVLRTPTLIVAGAEDGDLGPDAQARLMAPHFSTVEIISLPDAGHLLPLERPEIVASLIARHTGGLPPVYAALIASDRVSARTRATLSERGQPDDPNYRPAALTADAFATLRAVLDRVVPQAAGVRIDLAARLDAMLATGAGDGWRFTDLPPDADAYGAGLATLEAASQEARGQRFAALDGSQQDTLLRTAASGTLDVKPTDPSRALLSASQMVLWFSDLRADAVKAYVAHPQTLARMGYSGVANGGDGPRKQGFHAVGVDRREAWEPEATTIAKDGTVAPTPATRAVPQ